MTGFLQAGRPPLILASESKARARLLQAAGLAFIAEPPGLDEAAMRQAVSGTGALSPQDVAEVLARAKAEAVSELARDAFVIGAETATPGYLPGPVTPGTWRLLLGPYTVHPDGLTCRVEVTLTAETASPTERSAAAPAPRRARGRGRAWYRGDPHTHTVHSDGRWEPAELVAAAAEAGLDFFVSTEHNTNSAHAVWGRHAREDLLIIDGEEVTTRNGHLVAAGLPSGTWLDWRHRAADGSFRGGVLDRLRADGALAIAAHPHAPCLGCQWKHGLDGLDAIEVWNGPWTVDDEVSLQQWNSVLSDPSGWLPAVGSSDTHGPESPVGLAQTVVLADDLSVSAVLAGMRAGRSYIAESSSVALDFQATADGRAAGIGETLDVALDREVTVELHVQGVTEGYVRLVTDQGWMAVFPLPQDGEPVRWTTTPARASYVRAEVRHAEGGPMPLLEPMAAFTNPIFLGRPVPLRSTRRAGHGTHAR